MGALLNSEYFSELYLDGDKNTNRAYGALPFKGNNKYLSDCWKIQNNVLWTGISCYINLL